MSATGEKLISSSDQKKRQLAIKPRTSSRSRQKSKPQNLNPDEYDRDPDTVFITELHSNYHQQSTDRAIRTVTFANKLKTDGKEFLKSKIKEVGNVHEGTNGENTKNKTIDVQNEAHKASRKVKTNKPAIDTGGLDENANPFNSDNKELVAVNTEACENQQNINNKVAPPDDEEPDMKDEIRKWIKKTYEFF